MEAIGMIETRGITASIIGADAMLKSANVKILEKSIVGGGNVVITVTGDIGAVNAAVEAGESSIKNLNSSLFVTKNIIPRPEKSLENTILFPVKEKEKKEAIKEENNERKNKETKDLKKEEKEVVVEVEKEENEIIDINNISEKKDLDKIVLENDISKVDNILSELRVRDVRKLARQYDELEIKSKDIKTATKANLIKELKKYYEENKVMKS